MSQNVLAEEVVRKLRHIPAHEGLLAGLGTLLFQPTTNSFQILFQHSGPSPDVRFHEVRDRSHGNCIFVDISSLTWSALLDRSEAGISTYSDQEVCQRHQEPRVERQTACDITPADVQDVACTSIDCTKSHETNAA